MTKDGKSLLFRNYGDSDIDRDLLSGFLSAFSGFMKEISQSEIKNTATDEFKYYYTIINEIIIVVCADLEDDDSVINSKITTIKSKFIEEYGAILKNKSWGGNRGIFTNFLKELDNTILGQIKISILGVGGVGKSTLLRLICGKNVDLEYIPTMTADIASIDGEGLGTKREIILWDFAGQYQFRRLWHSLLEGTDIALIVTDSTFENINSTKTIIHDTLEKYYKHVHVIGIANKQDLQNRLSPEFCEKLLSDDEGGRIIKVHGMIAVNENYREKIFAILSNAINALNP